MLSRLSIACLLALSTPAFADGHLALKCENLNVAKEDDVRTAFLCLADYQQRLQALEGKIGKLLDANTGEPHVTTAHAHMENAKSVPSIGNHSDTRAVIAYTSEKGERACPAGWSPFEEAKNRFIIGAGDQYRIVKKTGGQPDVKLENKHMPGHTHRISTNLLSGGGNWHAGLAGSTGNTMTSGIDSTFNSASKPKGYGPLGKVLESEGGDEAHDNMPPWIALYYCIKDG